MTTRAAVFREIARVLKPGGCVAPSDIAIKPTPWSQGCWKVLVNDGAQLAGAIPSVERHPMKEGLLARPWAFSSPFSRLNRVI